MEEREIERVAREMGRNVADQLNVEQVAAGVVARLRADRALGPRPRRLWWAAPVALRLAAALAVLVTGGVLVRGALDRSQPVAAVTDPVLRDLSADELTEVFDSLAVEAPIHEVVAVGLDNLTEEQLKELLLLLEG